MLLKRHRFRNGHGSFTEDEYKKTKTALKPGKKCRPRPHSIWSHEILSLDEIILDVYNAALLKNQKPSQWSLSIIIPLSKKGDLSYNDNYRGTSLILFRIRNELDPKL